MEIKLGMYVRTEYGIGKYKKDYTNSQGLTWRVVEGCLNTSNQEDWQDLFSDSEIIKASHNIIDLIEVGDYVNGKKVERIDKDSFIKGQVNLWTNDIISNYWGDISLSPVRDKEVKSIVTKEQFESMSYKVGD